MTFLAQLLPTVMLSLKISMFIGAAKQVGNNMLCWQWLKQGSIAHLASQPGDRGFEGLFLSPLTLLSVMRPQAGPS